MYPFASGLCWNGCGGTTGIGGFTAPGVACPEDTLGGRGTTPAGDAAELSSALRAAGTGGLGDGAAAEAVTGFSVVAGAGVLVSVAPFAA